MAMESASKPKNKKLIVEIVSVVIAAVVTSSVLFIYYSPDYSWSTSIRDHDGDGYPDKVDVFPYDSTEWNDSDGDGYGDGVDRFPTDPSEWNDSDGDGYGDRMDRFPTDSSEWNDSDRDGFGDNSDLCDSGNILIRIQIEEFEQITLEEGSTSYVDDQGTASLWDDVLVTYYFNFPSDVFFRIELNLNGDEGFELSNESQVFDRPGGLAMPYGLDYDIMDNCTSFEFRILVFLRIGLYDYTTPADYGGGKVLVQYPYNNQTWAMSGGGELTSHDWDCYLKFSLITTVIPPVV